MRASQILHRVRWLAAMTLLVVSSAATAAWQLDPERSSLSFVTIKAADVAEAHTFTQLEGGVDDTGLATVTIQLASVDTLIQIRDQRMREMLFKTDVFPTATVRAQLEHEDLSGLSGFADVRVTLEMTGKSLPINTRLLITRGADGSAVVTTTKPILINAASLNLTEGVEALREIAGLPSISRAVPVTFVLTFKPAA